MAKLQPGEFQAAFECNGEKIFWTEGYSRKEGAKDAIASIKKNGSDAEVDDTAD
jgi:uncharacterized protein YegP (UPF0339 family)